MSRKKSPYQSIFSYYGGKSKIAHLYPQPKHDLIIEPFAGAAAYSLRYHDRQVWINDLDPVTWSIWDFLLSQNAVHIVENYVPDMVKKGDLIDDLIDVNVHHVGFVNLLRSAANQGTMGSVGVHNQVTLFGQKCWHRLKPRLLHFIPRVSHWSLTRMDYVDLINSPATWFIDPPYANSAGNRYRTNKIDYFFLSKWVKSRFGQVIVCENVGADWLPFQILCDRRGVHSRYQKSTIAEVVFTR